MPHWRPEERVPVTILGATGLVGQTLVRRLQDHPWFTLAALAASPASAGRRYGEALRGSEVDLPTELLDWLLVAPLPEAAFSPIVLSALDAATAREVEPRFVEAGALVVSNASAFRLDPGVPLVVPEVNPDVLLTAEGAGIVCNPNCVAAIVALALAPLHARWGLRTASITTFQSVSGAGHPGVSSLDLLGNVIPYIAGEEEKIAAELGKILAAPRARIGVQAHRVPVLHGHTASLVLGFERRPDPDEAARILGEWRGHPAAAGLPSLPEIPLRVSGAADRPQPRLDFDAGEGMTVTVGRVREDPVLDLRLVVCGNNLVRGAAGAAIANAELAVRTRSGVRTAALVQ